MRARAGIARRTVARAGRVARVGLAVALLVAVPVRAQTTALPARLSDAEFWNIFTSFSEEGGTFLQNFTSNEGMIGRVATDVISRGRTGGAYIGVGPEQNFTYIAALQPQISFIVDIRRQAAIQQLMYKAIFELSSTRVEFIERLFAMRPPAHPPLPRDAPIHDIWLDYLTGAPDSALFVRGLEAIRTNLTVTHGFALSESDLTTLSHVYSSFFSTGPAINYLTGMATGTAAAYRSANFASLTMTVDSAGVPRSFLASEENFARVKDMQARNMIIPIIGDFGGPQALRAVGKYLQERRSIVNAFYVSNVEQYLIRPVNKLREFYDNVAALPLDTSSVFMRPGAAGSTPIRGAPFGVQLSAADVRAYVDSMRQVPAGAAPVAPLCPILPFLAAFNAGRVLVYADAENCVR